MGGPSLDSGNQLLDDSALREGDPLWTVFFHKVSFTTATATRLRVSLGERAASDHANAKCAEIFGVTILKPRQDGEGSSTACPAS